jgi:glycosyltransferase involved in cell wall biosynthesis
MSEVATEPQTEPIPPDTESGVLPERHPGRELAEPAEAPGKPGRVLFTGQSYYNTWYLSRALRELGWKADVLNNDDSPASQHMYRGHDHRLTQAKGNRREVRRHFAFYRWALRNYDVFHFSNAHGIYFSTLFRKWVADHLRPGAEIRLMKRFGKKIVYSSNGCLDGVSQTSFASWGDRPVCLDCPWRERPDICSDERNLEWGKFRNEVADYVVLIGGNQIDYNAAPHCHEVPEFYCLDTRFWNPELMIPTNYRLPIPDETVKIYHAVGDYESRTEAETTRNLKSTHVYLPVIDRLKERGLDVELIFFGSVPNEELRYYQAQADIVVDMLTFGMFGANVREAMMLGKPVVCYLRPEWMEQMRREVPAYVDELPIVSATPDTVEEVLADLVANPEKRREIGRRSRQFAAKWHSPAAAARRFDVIYRNLLAGRPGSDDFR